MMAGMRTITPANLSIFQSGMFSARQMRSNGVICHTISDGTDAIPEYQPVFPFVRAS